MAEKLRLPDSLAALQNVSSLLALIERCEARDENLPGIGVFYGRPGLGKTSAAICAAILMDVVHIVVPPFASEKTLLVMLARELGLQPKRVLQDIYDQVAGALMQSNRTLVLDEADFLLRPRLINTVRVLHDQTFVPIILMGEEDLPQQLLRWERVHGRVLDWVGAADASLADVDMLARIHARGIEIAPDLRQALLTASGHSHRYIATNLVRIRDHAVAQGLVRIGRAEWGDRAFNTGAAPSPRSIPLHKQRPVRARRAA